MERKRGGEIPFLSKYILGIFSFLSPYPSPTWVQTNSLGFPRRFEAAPSGIVVSSAVTTAKENGRVEAVGKQNKVSGAKCAWAKTRRGKAGWFPN